MSEELHQPGARSGDALVLTQGAGGNARAPLLVALGEAFAARLCDGCSELEGGAARGVELGGV
ncbi:MAG: hypothetical protein ACREKH_04205, partial [Candidatus Rokuibacteriota bacterium]